MPRRIALALLATLALTASACSDDQPDRADQPTTTVDDTDRSLPDAVDAPLSAGIADGFDEDSVDPPTPPPTEPVALPDGLTDDEVTDDEFAEGWDDAATDETDQPAARRTPGAVITVTEGIVVAPSPPAAAPSPTTMAPGTPTSAPTTAPAPIPSTAPATTPPTTAPGPTTTAGWVRIDCRPLDASSSNC